MSEKLQPLNPLRLEDQRGEWEEAFRTITPGKMRIYAGDRARTARLMYYYLKKRGKLPEGLRIKCKNVAKEDAEATVFMEVKEHA